MVPYVQFYIHYLDKQSVVRPYLKDSPPDDGLMSCQLRGTFMPSCQPRSPAARPLPSLPHPGSRTPPPGALGVDRGVLRDLLRRRRRPCPPAYSRGMCNRYRTHPPGVSASESGLRPVTCRSVSVSMCVRAASSIWTDGPGVRRGGNDNRIRGM